MLCCDMICCVVMCYAVMFYAVLFYAMSCSASMVEASAQVDLFASDSVVAGERRESLWSNAGHLYKCILKVALTHHISHIT